MRKFVWFLIFLVVPAIAIGAAYAQQQAGPDLSWAFAVPDKNLPPDDPSTAPKHVPGSTKAYTAAQIDDLLNPPDWFPNEHPAAPNVVAHGSGAALGCGSCHLMSGLGHPESANLAGLPAAYIEHELTDFKSGARIDPARMNGIAKALSDEDIRQAGEYFASLKPLPWIKVVETVTVPKTWVGRTRMRFPLPGGETEPIGNRIIEIPKDSVRVEERDPHSGFIAYAPPGSIKKGEKLATTGGDGKTLQCSMCHGPKLTGMGDVPRIAGLSPTYVGRQLYNFKKGTRNGEAAAPMKGVVANLTDEDIVSLAAYVASRKP
jgi:cytochrome c553